MDQAVLALALTTEGDQYCQVEWLCRPDFCTQWSSSKVLSEPQASTTCQGFGTAARLLTELYYLGCTFEGIGTGTALVKSETPCTHGNSEIPDTLKSQLSLDSRLRHGLELMISKGHDLGTAYAWFRTGFKSRPSSPGMHVGGIDHRFGLPDLTTSDHDNLLLDARHPKWHDWRQVTRDREGNQVVLASVPPRRLWDVVANRVIPYYWHDQAGKGVEFLSMESVKHDPEGAIKAYIKMHQITANTCLGIWTVSHAWTRDMQPTWTSVNKYEWPVPLPAGVELEDIRAELLGQAAEYVWIDVLCLRQSCDEASIRTRPGHAYTPFDLQTKAWMQQGEWMIDVPTIGNVYHTYSYGSLRYYSGLGRLFSLAGWGGERHWINRAWTLQETIRGIRPVIGGLTLGECWEDLERLHVLERGGQQTIKGLIDDIEWKTQSDQHNQWRIPVDLLELIPEMGRRHASNQVDKIAGLSYILGCEYLPTYSADESLESAWGRLVAAMDDTMKRGLIYGYPCMSAAPQWYPTWQQMMEYPKAIPQVLMPKLPLVVNMLSEPLVDGTPMIDLRMSFELVQSSTQSEDDGQRYLVKTYGSDGQRQGEGVLVQLAHKGVILPDGDYAVYQSLGFNRLHPKVVCWEIPGTRAERERVSSGENMGLSSLRSLKREVNINVVKLAVLDTSSSELLTLQRHRMGAKVYLHFR